MINIYTYIILQLLRPVEALPQRQEVSKPQHQPHKLKKKCEKSPVLSYFQAFLSIVLFSSELGPGF